MSAVDGAQIGRRREPASSSYGESTRSVAEPNSDG